MNRSSRGRRWATTAARLLMVWLSIGAVLGVFEIALRTMPGLQELDSSTPIYVPRRLSRADREIDMAHRRRAEHHRYGFNDVDRSLSKTPGTFRVVVLGDSFVFGDGVPEDVRWSRKLEARLGAQYENVEVLHWGQNGWATLDQFRFLEAHASEWSIDALLIGYVENDPDMEDSLRWSLPTMTILKGLGYRRLFPEACIWLEAHVASVLDPLLGSGYHAWRERLYERENLEKWTELLGRLDTLLEREGIPYVFVTTPRDGHPDQTHMFEAAVRSFEVAGNPNVDLLPVVRAEFGEERDRRLWANPADGHPGALLTALYARESMGLISTRCESEETRLIRCDFSAELR